MEQVNAKKGHKVKLESKLLKFKFLKKEKDAVPEEEKSDWQARMEVSKKAWLTAAGLLGPKNTIAQRPLNPKRNKQC